MPIKEIDLTKNQHGWFAKFSDTGSKYENNKLFPTGFTRHAKGWHVERAIARKFPEYAIYVIGG